MGAYHNSAVTFGHLPVLALPIIRVRESPQYATPLDQLSPVPPALAIQGFGSL